MKKFIVGTYSSQDAKEQQLERLRILSELIHKLRGGDRTEPVDLSTLSPTIRRRAAAKLAAGKLAQTLGYSTPIVVPDDPRNPEGAGEVRLIIDDQVQTDLARFGVQRLTDAERHTVQHAVVSRVTR